jgi:hypothetical protein
LREEQGGTAQIMKLFQGANMPFSQIDYMAGTDFGRERECCLPNL